MCSEWGTVELYIYDISRGLAKKSSNLLLGKQIDGIWHTGIVVYGKEYYFGTAGITKCEPGQCETNFGRRQKPIVLGTTRISKQFFDIYLHRCSQNQFRPDKYNLYTCNCNTFTNKVAKFLLGKEIPELILTLPQDILDIIGTHRRLGVFGVKIWPLIAKYLEFFGK